MHRAWRPAAGLALAAIALGGLAPAAHAGTASGRPAQFAAAPGEPNDLTVDAGAGGAVQFIDAAEPIGVVLPWCTPFPLGQALCDPDGDPRDTDGGGVSVDLGDGDDRAMILFIPGTGIHPGQIAVAGGSGNDHLENTANGVVRFDGGAGDDRLVAGAAARAILRGGAGADVMTAGAGCCAVADYADHDGVHVTLDETANDGFGGERDDVRTSGVTGSPGPDLITGDARDNALTGSGGADVLDGAGGDDVIRASTPDGGSGDGGDGVTCGAGRDDVTADAGDRVALDCERVRVGAGGPSELVLDMGAGRADRSGGVKVGLRTRIPSAGDAATGRSTFRLLDRQGRTISTTARFGHGAGVDVVRLKVRLYSATRRRLARSRSGALALVAQRVSRDASPAATVPGYERFNTAVTIRRARRR